MRQIPLLILGLVLMATGAQGLIKLLIGHDPGVLRHVPGGYPVQLVIYGAVALVGFRLVRRHRVHPDPEHDTRAHRHP